MTYANAEGFKIRDQHGTHFLTFTVEGWIDIFTRQRYRDIIIDSMDYCRKEKDLQIGAYVIMSNHIHVIWTARNGNLSDIVRDFKTHTSKAITKSMHAEPESRRMWLEHMFQFHAKFKAANTYYKVWTNNNHPEHIFSESFLHTKLNYIHQNPVRAGLVYTPEDYVYSSAASYAGRKGLIDIDFLY